MTPTAGRRIALLDRFACLGPACADTCCRGWDMQVDDQHLELYRREAPELVAAVDATGPQPIMRRDASGHCVRLAAGWCGVHKARGTAFLGDACNFYPRVTRALGGLPEMAATPSCPEIARLALAGDDGFQPGAAAFERLPNGLRESVPPGLDADAARRIVAVFDAVAADSSVPPEHALARIATVARTLTWTPAPSWPGAIDFLIGSADERLAMPEPSPDDDVRLLHGLAGLIKACRHRPGERLTATLNEIQAALGVTVDWTTLDLLGDAEVAGRRAAFAAFSRAMALGLAPLLRRWLRLQLALGAFPFAGLGSTPEARATLIGVHFATARLALAAHAQVTGRLAEDGVVRVVQSLARLLDHLATPDLWLALGRDAGWHRESRLRGLLEGGADAHSGTHHSAGIADKGQEVPVPGRASAG